MYVLVFVAYKVNGAISFYKKQVANCIYRFSSGLNNIRTPNELEFALYLFVWIGISFVPDSVLKYALTEDIFCNFF